MPRRNNNAGQPNRVAQTGRRSTRLAESKKHRGREHHRSRAVLGPLSEHLINTGKPQGELVEGTRYKVAA